jgi:oligopeptide/dipeptide ABC transporter ATP-binding protein
MILNNVILKTNNLKKHFPVKSGVLATVKGHVKAVDGISMEVMEGETFGIVGESGCGKSTLGRLLLRLIEPTGGECSINEDRNIFELSPKEMRMLRKDVQIIFQDPYASLNPKMKIGDIVGESLKIYKIIPDEKKRKERVQELLEKVGLSKEHYNRFPHEFSGGQRQRVCIARALALNPKLIVCDEAVSALDVSVQAQILNLLKDLQKEFNLTYIFISHDLSVIKFICNRVGVMYLGKIVELADSDTLFNKPAHPYTRALLSAIPEPNPRKTKDKIVLNSDMPNPINLPKGCRFHTRCEYAVDSCKQAIPELEPIAEGHFVACFRKEEI